jgi:hypothetical protein
MVGQFTSKRGYTRNFAYRVRHTVRPDTHDSNNVMEINPMVQDVIINNRLVVQMKSTDMIKKTNKLFDSIMKKSFVVQGEKL